MMIQIVLWWLVLQVFGAVGLPLTMWLFRGLPDRGYAYAKVLGLLLTGYCAWLLAMLGLAPFGFGLVVVCALLVGVAGVVVWLRSASGVSALGGMARWRAVGAAGRLWVRAHWRAVVGYEVLFAAALVFLAFLRSYQPDPWGTERPMDFALFNAIRRSASFPPHDPWLAGYSINYYYFGYLLVAIIALVSGLEPTVAYNLGLAAIFALVALGVAGVVANLIALTKRADGRVPGVFGRAAAVVLGVVLVLVAANQGGALQVITGSDMAVALDGPTLGRAIVNGLGAREPLRLDPPFRGDYFDGTSVITPTNATKDFNWWNSSRALWDDYSGRGDPVRHYTITEFPFFSFWLGDMHPHVMALPFGLLALALALQMAVGAGVPRFGYGARGWLELGLTGIVLGSLYVINSWDFPTYLLLYLGALVLRSVRVRAALCDEAVPDSLVGWRYDVGQALLVVLATLVLFTPFYLTFRSLVGGKEPLIALPIIGAITRVIGVLNWTKTPLYSFLIIFGLFLVPLVGYVLALSRWVAAPTQVMSTRRLLVWVTLVSFVLGVVFGFPLLFLLPLAILAGLLALEYVAHPAPAFGLWVMALGCLICFGTELIYIRDMFEGFGARLNTIFKFYYQTWLLWGTLAAYAWWWLVVHARRSVVVVVGAVSALLLVGALVYPWLSIAGMVRDGRHSGLVGRTPREFTPDGQASIGWLREQSMGNEVILEAVGDAYDTRNLGFGGVSASTGLATVLGWPGHELQWRGGDPVVLAQIEPRRADVVTMYSTTDVEQARSLLAKYAVTYVYVGGAERATYPPEGLSKFEQLGEAVFHQGDVTIYQVKPAVSAMP